MHRVALQGTPKFQATQHSSEFSKYASIMDSRHGNDGPNLRFLASQQSGCAELGSCRLGFEADSSRAVLVKGSDVGVGFLAECLADWID